MNNSKTDIPESVVKWLFQVIQPIYKHDPRATFHDTMVTLTQFGELRPRTRVYTDHTGQSKLLLMLYGQLRNGLPVIFWIPDNYPATNPLVFIDITCGVSLQRNEMVLDDGQLQLDHFQEWNPQTSNIAQIVQCIEGIDSNLIIIPQVKPEPVLSTPPPLPPKPTERVETESRHGSPIPQRAPQPGPRPGPRTDVVPPPITNLTPVIPKDNVTQTVDLMDSLTLDRNTQHEELIQSLQQILNEMTQNSQLAIEQESTNYAIKYNDVINKFNENLQYQLQTIKYVNENITSQKQILAQKMEELDKFQQNKLSRITPPRDPSEVIATDNDHLYKMVSLDYALTDCIQLCYHLLNKGTVTVDQFIKETRRLGTLQFQTRDAIVTATASH
ncbi:hypothetical protein C6P45_002543 [Maudiozyma exigua]|uniref:UEV domain-containing protein n=1 Tax=Maudiozyma exigua TaxID=34358 RepID=A0A9P7B3F6_MAUEX|nr:hypothetical protein C6P45_002543 [Kazachstania exigua]